jgi:hypothetical protein
MKIVLLVACIATGWMCPATGLACSASFDPYIALESVAPADGTEGFPRDGSIGIQLRIWPTDITRNFGRDFSVPVSRVCDGVEVAGNLEKRQTCA